MFLLLRLLRNLIKFCQITDEFDHVNAKIFLEGKAILNFLK